MSTVWRAEASSRQLNEAARLANRYGRSEWSLLADGCMVVRCVGDSPSPDQHPLTIVLDQHGRPVMADGTRRASPDD